MAACMQYAFHMMEPTEQKKHQFEEVEPSFEGKSYAGNNGDACIIKNVLYMFAC